MRSQVRGPLLLLLAALFCVAIFTFDYLLPLGVAGGVPYALVVLLGMITQRIRHVITLAMMGSLLTIVGYYVSMPGADQYMVLINRGLALLLIWSIAVVLVSHFSSLAKLNRLAIQDQVTGLFNRHWFFDEGTRLINAWRRYHTPLSLMLLDLDDFKQVNDRYGHEAGDRMLQAIAVICNNCVREADLAARIGGEEFAILMPSTTLDGARLIAARIQGEISRMSFPYRDQQISVTASIGITELEDNNWDLNDFLRSADRLLYEAKGQGKNRIILSRPVVDPHNVYLDSPAI